MKIGLLDAKKAAAGKPLQKHLEDFHKALLIRGTAKHANQTTRRIARVFDACGFKVWSDISGGRIDEYIGELRNAGSEQTASHYVKAFRQFAKWMMKERRSNETPSIGAVKAPKRAERAFEVDEFQKLLGAVRTGPDRLGMTGYERYVCYILAVETGLRREELRSIIPASFDFNNNTVFVRGKHTKNGDDATQHITEQTADIVKHLIQGKMLNVRLFNIHDKSAKMLQADCEFAGIEIENNRGKLKFHSLRHTCGTFLADQGVHPKVIQEVMRH